MRIDMGRRRSGIAGAVAYADLGTPPSARSQYWTRSCTAETTDRTTVHRVAYAWQPAPRDDRGQRRIGKNPVSYRKGSAAGRRWLADSIHLLQSEPGERDP